MKASRRTGKSANQVSDTRRTAGRLRCGGPAENERLPDQYEPLYQGAARGDNCATV